MILAYLKEEGYQEAFLTLEKQSNVRNHLTIKTYLYRYRDEVQYLKELLVLGNFKQAIAYMEIIAQDLNDPEQLPFLLNNINKQRFLEVLANTV